MATMTSASAAAALGRSTITRILARAFTHPTASGGGNPVTVFLSTASPTDLLPPTTRSNLAKSCEWESVIAHVPPPAASEQGQIPILSFYMPSGEEVNFCAHAAIGAAAVIASEDDKDTHAGDADAATKQSVEFTTTTDETVQIATISPSGLAELCLVASHTEDDISDFVSLGKIRDALGLRLEDVSLGGTGLPSYINSSIARNKTLFPILDVKRLHFATNPPDAEEFKTLCDKIKSTGIYLYSPVDEKGEDDKDETMSETEGSTCIHDSNDARESTKREEEKVEVLQYECRQFPRASGYPEDPATGIAAAALAASLRKRGIGAPKDEDMDEEDLMRHRYEFYQGTAMGRRSKIGVRFDEDESGTDSKGEKLKLYISGHVEILSRDEEELPAA